MHCDVWRFFLDRPRANAPRLQVQYPEVAQLYKADFDNLEVVTGWLFPENARARPAALAAPWMHGRSS